ncbi:MAG: glycerol-3-phosphate 1-O-acyltransferase PlsB [Steroidobacteraceae bacterium]
MDRLTGRFLLPWLRFTVRPRDVAESLRNAGAPVCYVIARHSSLDALVLQRACAEAGLPRPRKQLLPASAPSRVQSLLALSRRVGFWRNRLDRRPPAEIGALLAQLRRDPQFDALLVPVAVYWGRAPEREHISWLRLLFSEDWALASQLRRAVAVLLNGRNTVVEFGAGVSLRALVAEGTPDNQAARRMARHLNTLLVASRTAYVGPDLSHRRTLMSVVLRGRTVRTLVAQEAAARNIPRREALLNAKAMFDEIAADYSHIFVRLMERVLRRLWTRIYDGVVVAHADTIASVAVGNELVYVPCHRSTMDDVLMPYAIYSHGYAVPHIAAGINLNLPLVGPMLRKGGAFFLRRSFRGNPLYSAVFTRYLGAMMARGHPIQYFIEGARSRTGRSLTPKTGMLSMTVRSYLRQPVRPIMFVPVYIGYERVMEVDSYVGELSGKPKEKETLLGFLRSLKRLRENFGHVHVNIGEPIALAPLLDQHQADWRGKLGREGRGASLGPAVDSLAQRIMRNIHAAAAVTPVNLLATVMLATPRHVMRASDLQRQLALYLRLLRDAPYSDRVTVTSLAAEQIIAHGLQRGILERVGEEVCGLAQRHATSMVYYRNNVLHLIALPSLLACCFISNPSLRSADLQRLARRIYPYIAAELFLRWDEAELEAVVLNYLRAMSNAGLLVADDGGSAWRAAPAASAQAVDLSLLAQPTLQTIERYYLAIALLLRAGSGVVTQSELEKRCQQMAERMVTLYGFYSPEFFDRSLFEGFVSLLRRRGVLRSDAEGKLTYDAVLGQIADDAQLVLSEQLRHSILQLVHG